MKRDNRYGIKSLEHQFPTEDVCLEFLFDAQHSRECECGGTYRRVKGRKQFQCSKCRFQIAPTAGTIFHKSDTPLTLWFKAILTFSNAKSGISAKEMERQIEVTYKTAWRILMLIRKALKAKGDKLSGTVEVDAAYFGGVYKSGAYNKDQKKAIAAKSVVIGAVERGGRARAKVVPDASAFAHRIFLKGNVEPMGTKLMTDKSQVFTNAAKPYYRQSVDHHKGEYVRGEVYTNTIEAFWSHVKRSIKGTHKMVSKQHLQEYLDGFAFHWSNRYSDKERFGVLLGTLLQPVR